MGDSFPETRERWLHRLPHWEVAHRPHFITIRCAGTLPTEVLARVREIHAQLAAIEPASAQFALLQRQYFLTCETYLDRGEGFAPFGVSAAAEVALTAWREAETDTGWQVSDAVAMPNHVHFLLRPTHETPAPLRRVVRAWKGRVARQANQVLGRSGAFWQEDWFDRWMRTEAEEVRVRNYLRENPVKAGLVRTWREWPHIVSSADGASE